MKKLFFFFSLFVVLDFLRLKTLLDLERGGTAAALSGDARVHTRAKAKNKKSPVNAVA